MKQKELCGILRMRYGEEIEIDREVNNCHKSLYEHTFMFPLSISYSSFNNQPKVIPEIQGNFKDIYSVHLPLPQVFLWIFQLILVTPPFRCN